MEGQGLANTLRVVNIEQGMPTVDEARRRLIQEIDQSKTSGYQVVKIIHGYGSTGIGGKLKIALTRSMNLRKKEGKIRGFVRGEDWSIFNESTRQILERFPNLKRDPDLDRSNEGISLILL